ncbi:MAG TPA: CBS domain-containing protein [Candidatus Dormibacteraeota bacterium]
MSPLAAGNATNRPVRDVMRAGVVLCDADMSVREVARAMRDRSVRTVLAIDLSSELIGLIDERAVAGGWDDPDGRTAAAIMDPDPMIASPDEPVASVAQRMLDAGATNVLVAHPPPTEESGVWSEWKERGMPLGTLSVADIVGRLDELAAAVRAAPPRSTSPVQRAAPWIALAGLVLAIVLVVALILAYANGTHHLTNRPGL